MNQSTRIITLKRLGTAVAVLGLITAVPLVQADDETKVKIKENKVKIRGEGARKPLKPEVNENFVKGYTIPKKYHTHFREVPRIEDENVVMRYLGGRAYYVNSNDWKIVRVVELDPSVEVTTDTSAYVEGSVIPDRNRNRFIEVPNPGSGVSVRYYNDTAYYLDSSHRIVRTVPLMR